MTKILLALFFILLVISGGLYLALRSSQNPPKVGSKIVNSNPNIEVRLSARPKLDKFLSDKYSIQKAVTIVFNEGVPSEEQGQIDYWEVDGKKVPFGGSNVSLASESPTVNLYIVTEAVREAGWSEEQIAKYLERKLYSSLIGAQEQTTRDDFEQQITDYVSEISAVYAENIFTVLYAK